MALPSKINPPWTLGQARAAVNGIIDHLAQSGTPGTGGGGVRMVSGTVDLTTSDPRLVEVYATSAATVEGVALAADTAAVFSRTSAGQWRYMIVGAGTTAWTNVPTSGGGTPPPPADTTAPTSPTLVVDDSSQTQLVASYSGGTDAVGVTQYRVRIDGGTWQVKTTAGSHTFTGLSTSSSHTIDAQAGDAAGNWSASTTWTGSTAAAPSTSLPLTDTFTAADGTNVAGRTINGLTWLDGNGAPSVWGTSVQSAKIANNKATPGAGANPSVGVLDVGTTTMRVSAKLSHAGTSGKLVRLGFGSVMLGGTWQGCQIGYFPGEGFKVFYGADGPATQVGGNYTAAGTGAQVDRLISIEWNGTTLTSKIDGTVIASTSVSGLTGTKVAFWMNSDAPGSTLDDLTVEPL